MEIDIGEIILDEELKIDDLELDTIKVYPELKDLEVTPTSVEQNFSHPNSYGYDKVKVKAVSSDTLNITPTTSSQEYTGLYGTVNVSAVDNTIDNNISAENIKDGVSILGVEGNLQGLIGEEITVTPTTSQQTITPSTGKTGITQVNVSAVTSSIDNNIQAGNIKKDVNILGVIGTFEDQADGIIDRTITTLNINTDTIGSNGLRDASNLITVNAPNITRINSYGLYGCANLKNLNININNNVYATSNSFSGCGNLEGFDFEFSSVNSTSFFNCQKISKIICNESVAQIATNSVFSGCSSLKTLVLRRTSVVTLRNINSFDNTPFRNGEGGTIYVPNNLISSYQSATNWSSLESVTFKKIEGSI